jgi:glutamine synthetase
MAGVNGKYDLRPPLEEDVFHLTAEQRKKLNVEELPGSLDEAVKNTEKSTLVRECLGEHVFSKFVENKRNRVGPVPHPGHAVRDQALHADDLGLSKT